MKTDPLILRNGNLTHSKKWFHICFAVLSSFQPSKHGVGMARIHFAVSRVEIPPEATEFVIWSVTKCKCLAVHIYSLSQSPHLIFSFSIIIVLVIRRPCNGSATGFAPFYHYHLSFDNTTKRCITITTNLVVLRHRFLRDEQINFWNFNGVARMFMPECASGWTEWAKVKCLPFCFCICPSFSSW